MELIKLFLLAIVIVASIYGPIWAYLMWIPKTNKLRISTRGKGTYTFYRSELYRPIFGWTGFWASKYSGTMMPTSDWSDNKQSCEENIEIYKNLKNIEL